MTASFSSPPGPFPKWGNATHRKSLSNIREFRAHGRFTFEDSIFRRNFQCRVLSDPDAPCLKNCGNSRLAAFGHTKNRPLFGNGPSPPPFFITIKRICCIDTCMENTEYFLLGQVARILRCQPYQIAYLLMTRQVPEPRLRIGNKRIFTISDMQRIAEKLAGADGLGFG